MRISYNAPVVLSFTFLALFVFVITHQVLPSLQPLFVTYPIFRFTHPKDYFRLFSHILGHQDFQHFMGNFTLILLLGPILEEKYGSQRLLIFILITAFTTAVINTLFFSTGLLGASGIVFLFILLASFTTFKSGEIPLTFILVFLIFMGQEAFGSLRQDNISQFAHILGGIIGSVFGFKLNRT
jgi:membrane associated rhomboid family serine protease